MSILLILILIGVAGTSTDFEYPSNIKHVQLRHNDHTQLDVLIVLLTIEYEMRESLQMHTIADGYVADGYVGADGYVADGSVGAKRICIRHHSLEKC